AAPNGASRLPTPPGSCCWPGSPAADPSAQQPPASCRRAGEGSSSCNYPPPCSPSSPPTRRPAASGPPWWPTSPPSTPGVTGRRPACRTRLPGLPGPRYAATSRSGIARVCTWAAAPARAAQTSTTPATTPRAGPLPTPTPARCAGMIINSRPSAGGGCASPNPAISPGKAPWVGNTAPNPQPSSTSCPNPGPGPTPPITRHGTTQTTTAPSCNDHRPSQIRHPVERAGMAQSVGALARVEQHTSPIPAQQIPVVVAPPGGRLAGRAQHDQLTDGHRPRYDRSLHLDADPAPERHVIFDLAGQRAGLGVVPGGVGVGRAVDDDRVVAGPPLPRAPRRGRRLLEILPVQRLHGKVMVTLQPHRLWCFGQYHTVPDRSDHLASVPLRL